MPKFERNPSKERRDGPRRDGPRRDGPRRDSGGRGNFGDRSKFRDSGPRREKNFEMTKVTCSECQKECEVPFKPSSSKPVFCSECFESKGNTRKGSNNIDLTEINEKLDKIMQALKIE